MLLLSQIKGKARELMESIDIENSKEENVLEQLRLLAFLSKDFPDVQRNVQTFLQEGHEHRDKPRGRDRWELYCLENGINPDDPKQSWRVNAVQDCIRPSREHNKEVINDKDTKRDEVEEVRVGEESQAEPGRTIQHDEKNSCEDHEKGVVSPEPKAATERTQGHTKAAGSEEMPGLSDIVGRGGQKSISDKQ